MNSPPNRPGRKEEEGKRAGRARGGAGETPSALGARGEQEALRTYRALGFRPVAQRLRTRHGEIDLLVRRGRWYVAVEVKTRRGVSILPEQAVDAARIQRLERALRALVPCLDPAPAVLRVDVAAVRLPPGGRPCEVRIFPGALLRPPAP